MNSFCDQWILAWIVFFPRFTHTYHKIAHTMCAAPPNVHCFYAEIKRRFGRRPRPNELRCLRWTYALHFRWQCIELQFVRLCTRDSIFLHCFVALEAFALGSAVVWCRKSTFLLAHRHLTLHENINLLHVECDANAFCRIYIIPLNVGCGCHLLFHANPTFDTRHPLVLQNYCSSPRAANSISPLLMCGNRAHTIEANHRKEKWRVNYARSVYASIVLLLYCDNLWITSVQKYTFWKNNRRFTNLIQKYLDKPFAM